MKAMELIACAFSDFDAEKCVGEEAFGTWIFIYINGWFT